MINYPTIQLSTYFTAENLKKYFDEHLRKKKGGGRDHLSPQQFIERYGSHFQDIVEQCVKGKYKFGYYREMLVTKGRNRFPRILAIPTMRDRLVLGVLNQYLQAVYINAIKMPVPNKVVLDVYEYLKSQNGDVRYQKTDFHDFYGSIVKRVLVEKLKEHIRDNNALRLIISAIDTPVVPDSIRPRKIKTSHKGIPQGLSISNILAFVYMMDFDKVFGNKASVRYYRYVDDILYLDPLRQNLVKDMKKNIRHSRLGLSLSMEKNAKGNLRIRPFEFLGYKFSYDGINVCVSVKKTKVSMFLNKIAGILSRCMVEYKNMAMRQEEYQSDDTFCKYYIDELNLQISGFKSKGHLYGWMAYYQGISDLKQLHSIDYHIRKMLSSHKEIPEEISYGIGSIVKTYYDIRGNSGNGSMLNLDSYKSIDEKRTFLKQRRKRNIDTLEDGQVELAFDRYVDSLIRHTELNIGNNS